MESTEYRGISGHKLLRIPKEIPEQLYFGNMETWKHKNMDMETWTHRNEDMGVRYHEDGSKELNACSL